MLVTGTAHQPDPKTWRREAERDREACVWRVAFTILKQRWDFYRTVLAQKSTELRAFTVLREKGPTFTLYPHPTFPTVEQSHTADSLSHSVSVTQHLPRKETPKPHTRKDTTIRVHTPHAYGSAYVRRYSIYSRLALGRPRPASSLLSSYPPPRAPLPCPPRARLHDCRLPSA